METAAHAAIREVLDIYVDTWKKHDMKAWGALFTADADFVTHAGIWWQGNAQNVAGHEAVPGSVIDQKSRYELQAAAIHFLAEDVALVHARWYWPEFVPAAGGDSSDLQGIITMVLVRRESRWLIRASQNTKAGRPAGT